MARVTNGGTEFDPVAIDRVERRFWREIWEAAPRAFAVAKGMRRESFGPVAATVLAALPQERALNLILGGASADAAAEGFLEEAVEWAREQGVSCFAPLTPERPGTAGAEAALAAAGFERAGGWMRFVRDAHPPRFEAPAGVEVVAVEAAAEGAPFGSIAALGFGLPPWAASLYAPLPALPDWRCYLALLDGEPQACAAMLLGEEGAKLGIAATLEGGRRRGCQLALLRRRIEDAAAVGVGMLTVETDERVPGRPSPSYGNILRAGFEEAYVSPGWIDARLPAG
ncbi:MAG: hypothetical protein JSU06_10935 [Actinobacteria bacterium]|nr:hypothetical protein [Actinomycetota bacterium]